MIEEGNEFLIFNALSENDHLIAVVGWGDEIAREVKERFALLEKLSGEHPGLEDLVYGASGYVELFEGEEMEGKLSEACLDSYQELNWAKLASKPSLENPLRLSSVEFRITRWGNFYWAMMEKHGTYPSETQGLSINHEPELFEG